MFLSYYHYPQKNVFQEIEKKNLRPSVHVFAPQLVNVSPSQLLLLLTELLRLLSLPIKQVVKTWYLPLLYKSN